MNFADQKPGPAPADSDEPFKRSMAALSLQLAARVAEEPPEIAVGGDDDTPDEPVRRRPWFRIALAFTLATAVAAGVSSFTGRTRQTPPPAPAPAPRTTAIVLPPPADAPPPTVSELAVAAPAPTQEPAPAAQPPAQAAALQPSAPAAPPVEAPPPPPSPLDTFGILEVQARLRSLGINPGPLDGVAGPMTQAAVRRYEQANGQPPMGNLDDELLKRLRQQQSR